MFTVVIIDFNKNNINNCIKQSGKAQGPPED